MTTTTFAERPARYARTLSNVSAVGAEQEPVEERLFAPRIELSTIVEYRGRELCVTAEGLDADRFCDMLDRRFGPPTEPPVARSVAVGSAPTCPNRNCSRYNMPMEPSQHNGGFYCKGKDGRTGNSKGYCKEAAQCQS